MERERAHYHPFIHPIPNPLPFFHRPWPWSPLGGWAALPFAPRLERSVKYLSVNK